MITSVFSSGGTRQVPPHLALGFTAASLDGRITFARTTDATNPATYINSSGVLTSATNNEPRFDYDPVTLVCKGLLIEESRTNSLLNSEDFTAASWTSQGTTSQTATTVTDSDASLAANRYQQFTVANDSAAYVASWYVEKNQSQIVALQFQVFGGTAINYAIALDTATGSYNNASTIGSNPGTNATVANAGSNGWRVTIKLTNNSTGNTTARVRFYPAYASVLGSSNTSASTSITGTATCSKMQLELGEFATSYIPTTSAALTRNADAATITGTNFSGWWKNARGTVVVRWRPSTVSGTRPVIRFDDSTADNIIALRGNAANPELYIKATTDQAQIDAGAIAANSRYRLAASWAANSCAASVNGGVAVLDGSATIPAATQARLGSDGTNYLNGWLEAVEYWPSQFFGSELQVLSSIAGQNSMISSVIRNIIQP